MPVYEYRCQQCGAVFTLLFQSYSQAHEQEPCKHCGSQQTKRLFSTLSMLGQADPGPGRAAWPTSWDDTGGGNPETLRYWRKRIEREARLEEKYPELRDPSLLKPGSESEQPQGPVAHVHSHEHGHHHHYHEHPHLPGHIESTGGNTNRHE